jgi:capsular exopolysaccharide synthesis family protein
MALLRALRRRWIVASTLGIVLGAAAAAAVWFFLPPAKNSANVQFLINSEKIGYVHAHPDDLGENFEAYQSKQVHFLKSRMVLNTAMRAPNIAQLALFHNVPEPIEWMEKEIRIDFPSKEIIRMTVTGDDLDELKTLSNAVTKAYMAEIIEKQTKERVTRLEELRRILTRYKEKLASARRVQVELAKRSQAPNSQAQGLMTVMFQENLVAARKQLVTTIEEVRRMQVSEGLAAVRADRPIPDRMIATYLEKEPGISTRLLGIAAAEQAYEEAKRRAKNPDDQNTHALRKIHDDIETQKIILASERSRLRPQIESRIREASLQQSELSMSALKENLTRAKALQNSLEADIQKYSRAIEEAPTINQTMKETEFEIDQTTEEVKTLTSRVSELEIEQNDPPRVRVLQEAVGYKGDNFARRVQLTIAAGVLLLGLSAVGIALLEFRTRRVSTVDEVTQGLGVRVVGTVPACPRRIRNGVINSNRMSYWKSMLAESVDAARTLLLHHARREDLRIILVTSACGGEGKTSLSCHLAVSMARAGRKTLLIDGDLRNPSAHKLFNVALEPGLSSILRGEISVEDALHATQATGLWLMPAGACDTEALSMLARDGVQPVFDRVRSEFDFIIIDSSPVLPVADSLMVAQQVDGVLFAILREVSRLPKVHEAYQKLSSLGVRMLGAVVNGTSGAVYGNGGYASNSRYLTPQTTARQQSERQE